MSPPTRVGPGLSHPGPDDQTAAAGAPSRLTIPAAGDTAAVTRYLTGLIDQADGPVPLIDQLTADRLGTPAGTAAIARAALAGLRAKSPEVIRADLRRELLELDWLVRYRAREAGLDVHGRGSTDWPRIHQVATARAEYRQRWGVAC